MRDNFAGADGDVSTFPGGASLRSRDGRRGWVLAQDNAARALGGALAWARQFGIESVELLADDGEAAGVLARRAAAFASPPTVWRVTGRSVEPALLAPPPAEPPLSAQDRAYVAELEAAGLEPVVEHGVLVGEFLGLEVARVVDGALEVGVGKHDREAQKLMNPDRPTFEALEAAVRAVQSVRRADGQPHQINQLAAERWLRAVVCRRPSLLGASSLRPVSSTVLRADLRIPAPAPAVGVDESGGRPVVVVCSVGIDVDLVPVAADARLAHAPDARLVLVVPEPDAHPVTRTLAGALKRPAEVVTVGSDWRFLA